MRKSEENSGLKPSLQALVCFTNNDYLYQKLLAKFGVIPSMVDVFSQKIRDINIDNRLCSVELIGKHIYKLLTQYKFHEESAELLSELTHDTIPLSSDLIPRIVSQLVKFQYSYNNSYFVSQCNVKNASDKKWFDIVKLVTRRIFQSNINMSQLQICRYLTSIMNEIDGTIELESVRSIILSYSMASWLFEIRRQKVKNELEIYFSKMDVDEKYKNSQIDTIDAINQSSNLFLVLIKKLRNENLPSIRNWNIRPDLLSEILDHLGAMPINDNLINELDSFPLTCWKNILSPLPENTLKTVRHNKNEDLTPNDIYSSINFKQKEEISDLCSNGDKDNVYKHWERISNAYSYKFDIEGLKDKAIDCWKVGELEIWLKHLRSQKHPVKYLRKNMYKLIAIISQVIEITKILKGKKPRATQLMALCLYLDASNNKQSRLGEIATGEGKTILVAMLAAIKALLGEKVNVISSSPVLARRDAKKMKILFSTLGLTVANNCDKRSKKSVKERQTRYKSHVVYGDLASFQRDHLLTEIFGGNVFNGRVCTSVIIDEVDSMLLDKNQNVLYLSHEIPELDHLRLVYVLIYRALHDKNIKDLLAKGEIKKVNDDIRKRIMEAKNNGSLKIPNYLKSFFERRLPIWIENAIESLRVKENDPYVVCNYVDAMGRRRIVLIDKYTGAEMDCTKWAMGMQQFLQLKHQNAFIPESLKAVYISNMSYLKQFDGQLYGVSGTLGSSEDKELLRQVYNVDFFQMPRYRAAQFKEEDALLPIDQKNWISEICKDTLKKIEENRAVLIVCESITSVILLNEELEKALSKAGKSTANIRKYVSSKESFDHRVKAEDIIISTNLGGRGTDLTLEGELPKAGGLHVILSYLPENIRLEIQAYGRAGRHGQKGSGRLIHKNEKGLTLKELKHQRDLRWAQHIDKVRTHILNAIEIEKELLDKFRKLYKKVKSILSNKNKKYISIQLQALKSRWAFWLDSQSTKIKQIPMRDEELIISAYEEFESDVQNIVDQNDIIFLCESPHELIMLGTYFIDNKNYLDAVKCFDKVISDDPYFSERALFYKAYAMMLGNENQNNETKCEVKRLLKQARSLLMSRVDNLSVSNATLSQTASIRVDNGHGQYQNEYKKQISNIISILHVHIRCINDIVGYEFTENVFDGLFKDSNDEKHQFFEKLIKIPGLAKYYRISKKAKVLEVDGKRSLAVQYDGITKLVDIPASLAYCAEDIYDYVRQHDEQRIVADEDFYDFIETQNSLWKKLVDAELIIEAEDSNNEAKGRLKVELDSDGHICNLPDELQKFQIIIEAMLVSKKIDGQISPKEIYLPDDPKKVNEEIRNLLIGQKVIKPCAIDFSLKKYDTHESIESRLAEINQIIKEEVRKIFSNSSGNDEEAIDEKALEKQVEYAKIIIRKLIGDLKLISNPDVEMRNINKHFLNDEYPSELNDFKRVLFDFVIELDNKPSYWNWNTFAVGMLGVSEIIAGVVVQVCTLGIGTQISILLISEGSGDILYATQAGISGRFNWNEYALRKAISLAISLTTFGIGAYYDHSLAINPISFKEAVNNSFNPIIGHLASAVTLGVSLISIDHFFQSFTHEFMLYFGDALCNCVNEYTLDSRKLVKKTMFQLFINYPDEAEKIIDKEINYVLLNSLGDKLVALIGNTAITLPGHILSCCDDKISESISNQLSLLKSIVPTIFAVFNLSKLAYLPGEIIGELNIRLGVYLKNLNTQDNEVMPNNADDIQESINKKTDHLIAQITNIMINRMNREILSSSLKRNICQSIGELVDCEMQAFQGLDFSPHSQVFDSLKIHASTNQHDNTPIVEVDNPQLTSVSSDGIFLSSHVEPNTPIKNHGNQRFADIIHKQPGEKISVFHDGNNNHYLYFHSHDDLGGWDTSTQLLLVGDLINIALGVAAIPVHRNLEYRIQCLQVEILREKQKIAQCKKESYEERKIKQDEFMRHEDLRDCTLYEERISTEIGLLENKIKLTEKEIKNYFSEQLLQLTENIKDTVSQESYFNLLTCDIKAMNALGFDNSNGGDRLKPLFREIINESKKCFVKAAPELLDELEGILEASSKAVSSQLYLENQLEVLKKAYDFSMNHNLSDIEKYLRDHVDPINHRDNLSNVNNVTTDRRTTMSFGKDNESRDNFMIDFSDCDPKMQNPIVSEPGNDLGREISLPPKRVDYDNHNQDYGMSRIDASNDSDEFGRNWDRVNKTLNVIDKVCDRRHEAWIIEKKHKQNIEELKDAKEKREHERDQGERLFTFKATENALDRVLTSQKINNEFKIGAGNLNLNERKVDNDQTYRLTKLNKMHEIERRKLELQNSSAQHGNAFSSLIDALPNNAAYAIPGILFLSYVISNSLDGVIDFPTLSVLLLVVWFGANNLGGKVANNRVEHSQQSTRNVGFEDNDFSENRHRAPQASRYHQNDNVPNQPGNWLRKDAPFRAENHSDNPVQYENDSVGEFLN